MAYVALNIPDSQIYHDIIENILPDDLYDPNDIRKEPNFHITMFYNFPDERRAELREYVYSRITKPIKVQAIGLDSFHIIKENNIKYDVLYLKIKSPELVSLVNDIKRDLNIKDKFEIYVPHITLIKLKYGLGLKYKTKFNIKYTFYSKQFIFIPKNVLNKNIDLNINEKLNINNSLIDTVKNIIGNLRMLKYIVPQHMTLDEWLKYKKKHHITAKEYHKKHPNSKWKVVHSNPKQRGKVVKGMTNMSYEQALKAHNAIMISKIKRGKAFFLDV